MHLFSHSKNSDSEIPDEKNGLPYLTASGFWRHFHNYPEFQKATVAEKIEYLRFMQEVLKQDLVVHAATGLLEKPITKHANLLPCECEWCLPGQHTISFEGKTVVSPAYKPSQFFPAIIEVVREGFCPDKNYFTGCYFPDWELILITNGIHHAAVEAVLRRGGGTAQCDIIDSQKVYHKIKLNQGLNRWILPDGREVPVVEPRLALLYAISMELNEMRSADSASGHCQ